VFGPQLFIAYWYNVDCVAGYFIEANERDGAWYRKAQHADKLRYCFTFTQLVMLKYDYSRIFLFVQDHIWNYEDFYYSHIIFPVCRNLVQIWIVI
jgi:hypothetical protein